LPAHRAAFLHAAGEFWRYYSQQASEVAQLPGFEGRAVRQTLACLLARVDGRSPLEYLDAAEQQRQRTAVLSLIPEPPSSLPQLLDRFSAALEE
jgi:hypothetical protein